MVSKESGPGLVAREPVAKPAILYGNRRQLMAEKNLHTMLFNTQQELKRMTESRHQWELAYHRAEAKYANTLRQHLQCLKESSATFNTGRDVRPAGTQTEVMAPEMTSLADDDDIQEDGCATVPCLTPKIAAVEPSVGSKHGTANDFEARCDTSSSMDSGMLSASEPIPHGGEQALSGQHNSTSDSGFCSSVDPVSRTVENLPRTSVQSGQKSESESLKLLLTKLASVRRAPVSAPGISRGLFDKLAHENVRLQQALEDILYKRGYTIRSYLEASEYEENIRALRAKIHAQDQEIQALREKQQAGSGNLEERCRELEQKLHKQDAALVGRQALLQTVYNEYEKLQKQLAGGERLKVERGAHIVGQAPDSAVYDQVKECEEKLRASMKENDELRRNTEKLTVEMKEKESFVELLQGQLKVFEDDFNSERKEKEEQKHWSDERISELEAQVNSLQLKIEGPRHEKNITPLIFSPKKMNLALKQQPFSLDKTNLTVDCVPNSDKDDMSYKHQPSSHSPVHSIGEVTNQSVKALHELICPKCLRKFKPGEADKLATHSARCIDDDE